MRRRLLGAMVFMAACSGSGKDTGNAGIADGVYTPNDVTLIAPSSALGTISGQVLDSTGAPISGASAKASLPAGASTATTDSNGDFSFTKVPGGTTVGITISKTGYTTGHATVTVPDSAGNVPEENTNAFAGPISLFATTGTLTVSVVGYDGSLVSAPGIAVVSPGYGVPSTTGLGQTFLGSTTVSATSSNGVITFTGIPDLGQLGALGAGVGTIAVAFDPATDNMVSYSGATLYVTVAEALATPGVLSMVLPDTSQGAGPLAIIGSDCGSLVNGPGSPTDSLVDGSNSVSVAFNQPVDPTTVAVTLVDDDGNSQQAMINSTMASSVISFSGNLQPQTGYTVTVLAAASNSHPETQKAFTGDLFTDPNNPGPNLVPHAYFPPNSTGLLVPGSAVNIGFDSPLGLAGGSPVLAAYCDCDINGDGKRTVQGEYGSDAGGWPLTPNSTFPNLNGFSANYTFTYNGASSLPPGKPVVVLFGDANTPGTTPLSWVNGLPLNSSNSPGQANEIPLTETP